MAKSASKRSIKSITATPSKSRKYLTTIKLRDGGALIGTVRADSPAQARMEFLEKHYKNKVPAGAIVTAEIATQPSTRVGKAIFRFGGRLSQRALDRL